MTEMSLIKLRLLYGHICHNLSIIENPQSLLHGQFQHITTVHYVHNNNGFGFISKTVKVQKENIIKVNTFQYVHGHIGFNKGF